MNTAKRIALVVGAVLVAAIALVVLAVVLLGPVVGLAISVAAAVLVVAGYRAVLAPWHAAWGATDGESAAVLPGDDLVASGTATTRAITIAAPPEAVWPWLVQIGFGRAGWYSYDWLDNDGKPSASEIDDGLQDLDVGDRIPMTPELGFVVVDLDPPRALVARSDDGSTSWVLDLAPATAGSSRLVSRFRSPRPRGLAGLVWGAIAGPGAFIMERRMLLGIRARAEAHPAAPTT